MHPPHTPSAAAESEVERKARELQVKQQALLLVRLLGTASVL
jgi:hypothetical protein